MRKSVLLAVLLLALILPVLAVTVDAQVLGEYRLPYAELNVGGRVYAAYFDGSKLWVVYEQAGLTHIAVYAYKNGSLVREWVATVLGKPVKVAVDDALRYLAVVTDYKILAVYNVKGVPVLLLDRGFRYKPVELALASTKNVGTPDVVIIVDEMNVRGNKAGYWVYAYPLSTENVKRSELWIPIPRYVNPDVFMVTVSRLAGGRQAAPYVLVVWANITYLNYSRLGGPKSLVPAHAIVYEVYRVKVEGSNIVLEKIYAGNVTLGYEIREAPYVVRKFDYVAAYTMPRVSPLRNTTVIILSATLQQVQVANVTSPLPPGLVVKALVVIDALRNESIVRYRDSNMPLLDFYPLGGAAKASAITRSGDYLFVGSEDYNVYVFQLQVPTNVYHALYSISLGSPVDTVESAPVASVVVAGSNGGMALAFRVLDGVVYWRLPAQASVTAVSLTGSTYAAVGTENGRTIVFVNVRSFLHYLGFIVESKKAEKSDVIKATTTNITITGVYNNLLVNMTYSVKLSDIMSGAFYTLLPATNYTVIIDNPVLGVAVRRVSLFADVYYTLYDEDFSMPRFTLRICVNDTITHVRLNDVLIVANYTPILELPANTTFELVLRDGCASAKLPRGYYYLAIRSWRYHPQLEGVEQPIRLSRDMVIYANATPYTALVMFHVVATYGLPLAGANVTLVEAATGLRLSVTTGGGGTALLSDVPYGVYRVVIRYPYAYAYTTRLIVNSSSVYVNATLRLRSYYVTIMPVDAETGAPVKGARLEIVRVYDGFTIRRVLDKGYAVLKLEYGEYRVRLSALGYRESETSIIVARDTLEKIPLTPILYTVTIDVIDSLYQRPMQARIVVYSVEYLKRYESVTRTGHAVFQLRAGTYKVYVEPAYGLPTEARLLVPAATHLIVEVKPRNYTVNITPVDAELGRPLAELGYRASGVITCIDTGNTTLSFVNGVLTATLPYSTGCRVVVRAPGYRETVLNLGSVTSNITLVARLQPVKIVATLRVVSVYGTPLSFNATLREARLGVEYRVNGTGQAVVLVRPGNYTIMVAAPYHAPTTINKSITNATVINIRLKPRIYTVTLHVIDADTGKLVKGATAVIERIAPTPSKEGITVRLAGGVASIPLPWGTYRFIVTAPGYREATSVVALPVERVMVSLTPVKVLVTFRAIDKLTKKPMPNVTLNLYGIESGVAIQARTGKDGTVGLELRVDRYRVVALAPLHLGAELQIDLYNVSAAEKPSYTIALEPVSYTLTLEVYDGVTSKPLRANLVVTVERREGGFKKTFNVTGPRVDLTLPYGTYTVTVKADKYEANKMTVNLNQSVTKKVMLARTSYSVRVKVIDSRFGRPVPNAVVVFNLIETGATMYTGVTDSKGEVSASLPWGRYVIVVRAGGYRGTSRTINLNTNNLVVPVFIEPLPMKIVLDILPAGIIGGAIVGSAVWVVRRIRKRPAALEFEEEELE